MSKHILLENVITDLKKYINKDKGIRVVLFAPAYLISDYMRLAVNTYHEVILNESIDRTVLSRGILSEWSTLYHSGYVFDFIANDEYDNGVVVTTSQYDRIYSIT